jgi:basic amino acid/polyamine antiporter, APA family
MNKSVLNNIFKKKQLSVVKETSLHGGLKKTLGVWDLLFLGLGSVVGSGIFVLIGVNTALVSGPAVILSFAIAGITCILVALVYTEVASSIPSSGGSYTYVYVSLGELAAWMVGCAAVLQLCFCSTTVASGWSGYTIGILRQLDISLPHYLISTPLEGGVIDLPAFLLCLSLTFLVAKGSEESAVVNMILVIVKLITILFFIYSASQHIEVKNWGDNLDEFMPFGAKGVLVASGSLFLSYTGFDVVANATEESKNPKKDITIGLMGSIAISMLIYIAVATFLTGSMHYTYLDNKEPLAYALKVRGNNIGGFFVALGGMLSMATVILVQIFGLSRILMAMSRDGFLPKLFSDIHHKYSTPYKGTIIVGVAMALISGFLPIKIMGNLASLGTLTVLIFVSIAAMRLRKTHKDLNRTFRCPALGFIAPVSISLCGYLALSLFESVGIVYVIYLTFVFFIYVLYSRNNINTKFT